MTEPEHGPAFDAAFDWARNLADPDFRAWVRAQGLGRSNNLITAVPSTTVADVLSLLDQVDQPGPVHLMVADGTGPYGYRLVRLDRPAAVNDWQDDDGPITVVPFVPAPEDDCDIPW